MITNGEGEILLQAEGLARAYGERVAVRELDLTVRRGEVLGLLGPNGAGKSTTLRLLSGCLPPSTGRIRLGGVDLLAEPARAKRLLGYLPEHPPLYPELSVQAYLRFCARLRGVPRAERAAAVTRALGRCGLSDVRGRLIGRLSKGYQQRVGIAQALVHDPALVILDEPTVGLDPLQLRAVRALIAELRADHAVLFSSHILSEVQALCDRVLILARGRVVYAGPVSEEARADQAVVSFARDPGVEALAAVAGVAVEQALGDGQWLLRFADEAAQAALLRRALEQGWGLREWRSPSSSLEQLFLRATQQEAA